MASSVPNPVVVTGAFERHNFGDLLMGRIVEFFLRARGLTPLPASLLAADHRRVGGAWVQAIADLAPLLSPEVPIVHVGGETIPCTLRDGLRMNIPASWPRQLAARLASEPDPTGLETREFAYLTPPAERIRGRDHIWLHRFFHGQGASTLGERDATTRESIGPLLRDAEWLTARDERSVASLRAAGASGARFAWDCAVLQPCLGPRGFDALDHWEPPPSHGPLLVHAQAGFLERHTETLARQLAAVAGRFDGIRIGLAGLAANHDTVASAEGLARTLAALGCRVDFTGAHHVDAIVAGIKNAACVVSTSLHYRIIALTHGVPRVSLDNAKTANWAGSCDPEFPAGCAAEHVADAVTQALSVPPFKAAPHAIEARRQARASLEELVEMVARRATAPDARCSLPNDSPDGRLPLPPDHAVLPQAWIDAVGAYCDLTAAGKTSAEADKQDAREESRRLRDELREIRRSAPGRLARWFRK
jgi:hypothetical protein